MLRLQGSRSTPSVSAIGGIRGNTGRSVWWALALMPYPVGWLLGLVFGMRRLRGYGPMATSTVVAVRDFPVEK